MAVQRRRDLQSEGFRYCNWPIFPSVARTPGDHLSRAGRFLPRQRCARARRNPQLDLPTLVAHRIQGAPSRSPLDASRLASPEAFRRIRPGDGNRDLAREKRKESLWTRVRPGIGLGSWTAKSTDIARPVFSALEQLEWCVGYLYQVDRPQLARALARNRAQISERAAL